MPRTPSASHARRRHTGLLGLLLATVLTPAGILVGAVTAAALVGGLALHLDRAPSASPVPPSPSIDAKRIPTPLLAIQHKGETVSLVLAESDFAGSGNLDPFLFTGPSVSNEGTRQDHAGGRMPSSPARGTPMPGGGHVPGGGPGNAPSLTGPSSNPPSFGGPAGLPSGGSPPHAGPPHAGLPIPSQAGGPPQADGPRPPNHDVPSSSGDEPGKPQEDSAPSTLPIADHGPWVPPLQPDTRFDPPAGQNTAAQPHAVPEPSMIGLMALGIAALAWIGRRRTSLRAA
jgi:hypothetical protein